MTKSRGPRTEPWGTPQEEVWKEVIIIVIVIILKKLGYSAEKINQCCCGGTSRSKDKLILKQITVVRMYEDRIEKRHSGRTSVCDRRTFPVLRSTCG